MEQYTTKATKKQLEKIFTKANTKKYGRHYINYDLEKGWYSVKELEDR